MPFKLSFLNIHGLYGSDLDPMKQVDVFSEKLGPWECDEFQRSLWCDVSHSVGTVYLCVHTAYKIETGQWSEPGMMRVHEQYDSFLR